MNGQAQSFKAIIESHHPSPLNAADCDVSISHKDFRRRKKCAIKFLFASLVWFVHDGKGRGKEKKQLLEMVAKGEGRGGVK